jgi:hypothetical protein
MSSPGERSGPPDSSTTSAWRRAAPVATLLLSVKLGGALAVDLLGKPVLSVIAVLLLVCLAPRIR